MKHRVFVQVQLPDGTHAWLPIVSLWDDKEQVREFDSKKDARDWVEFVLPDKVSIREVKS